MDSRHVTNEQARAISQWLEPTVMHLHRLRERMESRGFPPDDRLYLQVVAAFKVLANLNGTQRVQRPSPARTAAQ